jgi:hypothetical protein
MGRHRRTGQLRLVVALLLAAAAARAETTRVSAFDGGAALGLYEPGFARDVPRGDDDLVADTSPFTSHVALRFDVSAIPPTTPLASAQLVVSVENSTRAPIDVYALQVPWSGAQATWESRFDDAGWSMPGANGADRSSMPVLTARLDGGDPVALDFGAEALALAQGWVDDAGSNHGLLIVNRAMDGDGLTLSSAEHRQLSRRPELRLVLVDGGVLAFQQGVLPTSAYRGAEDTTLLDAPRSLVPAGDSPLFARAARGVGLVRFDVSSIPPDARVVDASLRLTRVSRHATAQSFTARALRVTWSTTSATWLSRQPGVVWERAGADGPLDRGSDELLVDGRVPTGAPGRAAFVLSDAGVALLQTWVSTPALNAGLWLSGAGTSTLALAAATDPTTAPELTVQWLPGPDAGTTPDAGATSDAGMPPADAGSPVDGGGGLGVDAGLDGGVSSDGGTAEPDGGPPLLRPEHYLVGCTSAPGVGWAAALAWLVRRRRRAA